MDLREEGWSGVDSIALTQGRYRSMALVNVIITFEVSMAVTLKNDVSLDVTPCGFCKNRCFEGT
jgi:hypothetical protein